MSVFDLPPMPDPETRYRQQRDELLETERQILETDREFYLECMHNKTLAERETLTELRNGLILYWNIYRRFKDEPEQ